MPIVLAPKTPKTLSPERWFQKRNGSLAVPLMTLLALGLLGQCSLCTRSAASHGSPSTLSDEPARRARRTLGVPPGIDKDGGGTEDGDPPVR